MASISTDRKGNRLILFVNPAGDRKAIRLGNACAGPPNRSNIASSSCSRPNCSGARWRRTWPNGWLAWSRAWPKKLARVGLIPVRSPAAAVTLGPFLQAWLAARKGDYKPASTIAWGQVVKALENFLGADCPLESVTAARPKRSGSPCWRPACGRPRSTSDFSTRGCSSSTPSGKNSWPRTPLSSFATGPATHRSDALTSRQPTCCASSNTPPTARGGCSSVCPDSPVCASPAKP